MNNSFWQWASRAGKNPSDPEFSLTVQQCWNDWNTLKSRAENEKTKGSAETRRKSGQFLNVKARKYLFVIHQSRYPSVAPLPFLFHILMQRLVGVRWCHFGFVPSGLINQLSRQIQTGRISNSTIFNIAHRITTVPLDDNIKGRILIKFDTNL